MHFHNLPCDLIRIVGLYLKLEDVTKIKCTNKYINNSLNDKFFGVYWRYQSTIGKLAGRATLACAGYILSK